MESPYEIPNLENQKNDVGTCQKPFFYHITTGKFIKKSAVFHAQIHIEMGLKTYPPEVDSALSLMKNK